MAGKDLETSLASSVTRPNGKEDIQRALLLAAPTAWFETKRTAHAWRYFVERYYDLARAFNVTLGEIHLAARKRMAPTLPLMARSAVRPRGDLAQATHTCFMGRIERVT